MDVYEKVDGVARILGVAPSTVKKYYLLFEQEGYRFKRSQEGHVLFSNHDIILLKDLIFLKNAPGMTVPLAVKRIVDDEGITDATVATDMNQGMTVITKEVATVMAEMTELKKLVLEQSKLIEKQQKYIETRLDQHDEVLMQSLRESQETKRLLAAAQEEQQKKPRKGLFRFFSKDN